MVSASPYAVKADWPAHADVETLKKAIMSSFLAETMLSPVVQDGSNGSNGTREKH